LNVGSTLTPGEAARECWDVIVIGAGPAGSMLARQLAGDRLRVLIVEGKAFPRAKVCGGCLNPRGLDVLKSAGLGGIIAEASAPVVREFEVRTRSVSHRFSLPEGVSITRQTLDSLLLDAAISRGAEVLTEATAAVEPAVEGGRRGVRIHGPAGEQRLQGKIVAVADGLARSSIRKLPEFEVQVSSSARVGVGTVLEPGQLSAEFEVWMPSGRIVMAVGEHGYVGLARAEAGRVSMAAAVDPSAVKKLESLGAVVDQTLREVGVPAPCDPATVAWHGTPLLTSRPKRRSAERLFLLGDAAGYVEPFTGEGMSWALEGALAAGPVIRQSVENWDKGLCSAWEKLYRQRVRRRQWICRGLSTLLRHPRLAGWSLIFARRFPAMSRALITHVTSSPAAEPFSSG
jgi:flavin-dependent dehydrogenase